MNGGRRWQSQVLEYVRSVAENSHHRWLSTGKEEVLQTKEYKRSEYKLDLTKTDLSCLSERQRQVVLLVHGEGLSFAETGRRLGITRSNAYSTMRDVYKKLEKNN